MTVSGPRPRRSSATVSGAVSQCKLREGPRRIPRVMVCYRNWLDGWGDVRRRRDRGAETSERNASDLPQFEPIARLSRVSRPARACRRRDAAERVPLRRQWSKTCRAQFCCCFSNNAIPPFVGGMCSRTIRGAHRACQAISPFSTDSGGNPSRMMTRSSGATIRLHLRHFNITTPITLSMTRVERDETRRYLARELVQRTPFSRLWKTEVVGYD